MIYPTEMTIATGTTVYAADPKSDECIASREVRVSVTYRIDAEETDLADLACAKAAEVERARIAVCERIERDRADPYGPALDPSDSTLEPPDEEEEDRDPFPEEADYLGARCGPPLNGHFQNGGCPGNGDQARNGVPALSPSAPAGPERATEAETDRATKPQVLAIGSHFKRLGLSSENQTALLRARFGKFRPERLTRAEAAGLMRCLERNEWEPAGAVAH